MVNLLTDCELIGMTEFAAVEQTVAQKQRPEV
jgi:hypothetical protein